MTSAIDPTKPVDGVPAEKADLRANLAAAKAEIEALQTFTHPATGALAASPANTLGGMWANVKTAFGAIGDGVTDDTVKLQNAINSKYPLYFPPGTYKITASLTFGTAHPIIMHGSYALPSASGSQSVISGNFAGALLRRANMILDHATDTYTISSAPSGLFGVDCMHMAFSNQNPLGSCVELFGTEQSKFYSCHFDFYFRGLLFLGSNFGALVVGCKFKSSWASKTGETWPDWSRAYGLMAPSTVVECTFIGCGVGCMLYGNQGSLNGGRFEINGIGLQIGGYSLTPGATLGTLTMATDALLHSFSMESNYRHIWVRSAATSTIRNVAILGGTDGPPFEGGNTGEYGILCDSGMLLENVSAGGQFKKASIIPSTYGMNMRNVSGTNSIGPVFAGAAGITSINNSHLGYSFIKTIVQPAVNSALTDRTTFTCFDDLHLRGLRGLNIRDPNVPPNNFGRVEAAGISGATSLAVAFAGSLSASNCPINTISAANDVTATLPPGTYEYASTIITPRGQTGIGALGSTAYKSVVVGGTGVPPNGQRVDLVFGGSGSQAVRMRRIYRVNAGVVSGRFAGYWQLPITTNNFSDTGLIAFDGVDAAPDGSFAIPAETEIDANYQVLVCPSWTTAWSVPISTRLTTGFTIQFGTQTPDANQTVAWLLFRP